MKCILHDVNIDILCHHCGSPGPWPHSNMNTGRTPGNCSAQRNPRDQLFHFCPLVNSRPCEKCCLKISQKRHLCFSHWIFFLLFTAFQCFIVVLSVYHGTLHHSSSLFDLTFQKKISKNKYSKQIFHQIVQCSKLKNKQKQNKTTTSFLDFILV